jgi:ribosomal protein S27AE
LDLDELPDTVYAPLGTRGMQPLRLKECPRCGNDVVEKLQLVSKRIGSRGDTNASPQVWSTTTDEYEIKCGKCGYNFKIKCQNVFGGSEGKERIVTFVHIATEDGESEGWLGNF